jgi:16S rRNA (adenine1518-N6/adenine1519-N6)-dimethyltransferase
MHAPGARRQRAQAARVSRPPQRDAAGFATGAKKHLGQNFLHERGVVDKIVLAIDPRPGDRIVEIGPGQGALTLPLLDRHGALTAIEFDVLSVDFTQLAAGGQLRLVGNLPYNLSSPILFHALDHAAAVRDMHFMLQKEVVERMAAAPGNKVYGRLSVMLQAYCTVTPLFTVAPGAFRPAPKVDSAVVRLVPRAADAVGIDEPRRFAQIVRAAFGQRRKTLRNALDGVLDSSAMQAVGVRPELRAEQLAVADFIRLSNHAPA